MKKPISLRAASVLFAALSVISIALSPADASDDWTPVYRPKMTLTRSAGTIRIDGVLDDPGWRGAARAGNFSEHNPGDQTRPEVDTEVLVTFDDEHLYVAWICYDDPAEVRASFCERDNIFSDDYVILTIDPYGEATFAYEIAANPYGIPGDLLYSSAYGEDISYDMIYESAGRVTEFGWVVEMAIPFRGLRFPGRNAQSWRMDFWRNRPRESRF
ncbi:MAG: carbohydrate binding family 9 domain-containing protein, partial [Candidatus Krumholzibacteria bacterium]|nr:carbohydrate binding family 9 domain-containing protein [Candidatus Krumholzibacteria bacterium]